MKTNHGRLQRGAVFLTALFLTWGVLSAGAEGASVRGTVRIGSDPGEGGVVYLKEGAPKPPVKVKKEEELRYRC